MTTTSLSELVRDALNDGVACIVHFAPCNAATKSTLRKLEEAANAIESLTHTEVQGDGGEPLRATPLLEVTDEMVEAGARTIPATGVNWENLHAEYKQSCRGTALRILQAASAAAPPNSPQANIQR